MGENPYKSPKVLDAREVIALPKKQFLGLTAAEWGIVAIILLALEYPRIARLKSGYDRQRARRASRLGG